MSRFYVPAAPFAVSAIEFVRRNPGCSADAVATRVAYHWRRGQDYPYTIIERLVAEGKLRRGQRERIMYSCPGNIPTVTGYDEVLFVAESESEAAA